MSNKNLNVYYLLRIARNLSIKELADKLQVTTSYISAIEKGKRTPSKRLLRDYAKVLDVDEQVLKTFETTKEPNAFEKSLLKLLEIICNIKE